MLDISQSFAAFCSHLSHPVFFPSEWSWKRNISAKVFKAQAPLVSAQKLMFPHHARCVLFRFRYNRQSLLINTELKISLGVYMVIRLRTPFAPPDLHCCRLFTSHSLRCSILYLPPLIQDVSFYVYFLHLLPPLTQAMPPFKGRGR